VEVGGLSQVQVQPESYEPGSQISILRQNLKSDGESTATWHWMEAATGPW
jgi:hypothetical protein